MAFSPTDIAHMQRALELAEQGQGRVEPNPMVGCVVTAASGEVVGEGHHARFGGDHAEVAALKAAGAQAQGGTLYVTLEPCCHQGKTPPCSRAVIDAGLRRVVVALRDPFAQVDGGGIRELEAAGITVEVGLLEAEARRLNAPYLKLLATGRPWTIAKWAMTLDGKIATRTGNSQWISGPESRAVVHELRGRMDAVLVGRTTADRDDPLLTARPPGTRTPLRVVADRLALLRDESQLVRTAREVPVLVACGEQAAEHDRRRLEEAGCEVFVCAGSDSIARLESLFEELGRRRLTNLLVEGGGQLLGTLFDAEMLDELHVFIAPKLIGGRGATSPLGAVGLESMEAAGRVSDLEIRRVGEDVYLSGRVVRATETVPGIDIQHNDVV